MNSDDSIVAISTPPGRGGLGVVRLSGPGAREIADSILRFPPGGAWQPWRARLGELADESGHVIDQVVATFFEKPKSYTAEDMVEISCHGSPVILRYAVERAIGAGGRLAEPGEFTLRAFLNGRLDLPQAEAVRDLIEASTLYQARVAAQQAGGSVSRRIAPLKGQLLDLIALLEAGIDFAEDDIGIAGAEEILGRMRPIQDGITALAESFRYGGLVRSGLALTIAGRPNVGKSSLFNALLRQDRAIVTEIPGATRDMVSESFSIGGIPVRLCDTAGIRENVEKVESLGIERSFQAMADADLRLMVIDISAPPAGRDLELIAQAESQGLSVVVGNKCDLGRAGLGACPGAVPVSALTGEGIDRLREIVVDAVAPSGGLDRETGFITSLRQERSLRDAAAALEKCGEAVESGIPHEMLLLDLYAALTAVDAITGGTTADEILNRIFAGFCIGK